MLFLIIGLVMSQEDGLQFHIMVSSALCWLIRVVLEVAER